MFVLVAHPPLRSHRRSAPPRTEIASFRTPMSTFSKIESDFWLSPEIAAKAPKDVQPFFQSARGISAPYIKAGKWHAFSGSWSIVNGLHLVSLHGHTPGHTGYEFTSRGRKNPGFGATSSMCRRSNSGHPEVTAAFDIDLGCGCGAMRNQLLPTLAHENVVISGAAHVISTAMGRLRKQGNGLLYMGAGDIHR